VQAPPNLAKVVAKPPPPPLPPPKQAGLLTKYLIKQEFQGKPLMKINNIKTKATSPPYVTQLQQLYQRLVKNVASQSLVEGMKQFVSLESAKEPGFMAQLKKMPELYIADVARTLRRRAGIVMPLDAVKIKDNAFVLTNDAKRVNEIVEQVAKTLQPYYSHRLQYKGALLQTPSPRGNGLKSYQSAFEAKLASKLVPVSTEMDILYRNILSVTHLLKPFVDFVGPVSTTSNLLIKQTNTNELKKNKEIRRAARKLTDNAIILALKSVAHEEFVQNVKTPLEEAFRKVREAIATRTLTERHIKDLNTTTLLLKTGLSKLKERLDIKKVFSGRNDLTRALNISKLITDKARDVTTTLNNYLYIQKLAESLKKQSTRAREVGILPQLIPTFEDAISELNSEAYSNYVKLPDQTFAQALRYLERYIDTFLAKKEQTERLAQNKKKNNENRANTRNNRKKNNETRALVVASRPDNNGKKVRSWEKVLGITRRNSYESARKRYRFLATLLHPNKGGNVENFKRLQSEWAKARLYYNLSSRQPEEPVFLLTNNNKKNGTKKTNNNNSIKNTPVKRKRFTNYVTNYLTPYLPSSEILKYMGPKRRQPDATRLAAPQNDVNISYWTQKGAPANTSWTSKTYPPPQTIAGYLPYASGSRQKTSSPGLPSRKPRQKKPENIKVRPLPFHQQMPPIPPTLGLPTGTGLPPPSRNGSQGGSRLWHGLGYAAAPLTLLSYYTARRQRGQRNTRNMARPRGRANLRRIQNTAEYLAAPMALTAQAPPSRGTRGARR
jgi:hypothetical protein